MAKQTARIEEHKKKVLAMLPYLPEHTDKIKQYLTGPLSKTFAWYEDRYWTSQTSGIKLQANLTSFCVLPPEETDLVLFSGALIETCRACLYNNQYGNQK